MITDSHAHLYWRSYDGDRDEVLERARAADVRRIIVPGTDVSTSQAALDLAASELEVYPAAGIHPHDASEANEEARERIEEMCGLPECVAVGESGLDFFKEYSPRKAQIEAFYWHLDLARRIEKPLIVHCRDAHEDTARIIAEFGGVRGVMHCYSHGPRELEPYLEAGFLISFAGPVTYPRNDGNREAARLVPDELLLVETDSPFLAPQERRGKRNEPAYVARVLEKVAEVRGKNPATLARVTSDNAARLFDLAPLV